MIPMWLATVVNVVTAIGAIEWGLFALTGTGLVRMLSAMVKMHHFDTAVYALVGVCGVVSLLMQFKVIS